MKEVNDQFGNLRVVALQSKMAAGHEMYLSIGQVALEGIGSGRDERRIVLSPYSKQGRLMITEILLELWIECNIRAIVQNEVVLHLGTAWLADIIMKKKSLFRVVPRKDATGNVSVFHICFCLLNWNLSV